MNRLIWIVVSGITITGIIVWWLGWDLNKSLVFSRQWLNQAELNAANTAGNINRQQLLNFPQKTVSFIKQSLEKQKESAFNVVDKTKKSIADQARQTIKSTFDELEKSIGIKENNETSFSKADSNSSFTVATSAKINQPALFLLKNNRDSPSDYFIDWNDDSQEKGTLKPNEQKLVSHTWKKAGQYTIKFNQQKISLTVVE